MHMHIRSLDENTNADNRRIIIGATSHGNPIYATSNLKDKIIAYTSIALGVIGFAVFFYFYLTPLIKDRKRAKAAKRRRMLMKPLLCGERHRYGLADSCSFYSADSKELEPLVQPRRIVPKDVIAVNRARQTEIPVDLEPLNFVSRPPPRYDSRPELNQSPFGDHNASPGDFCTSTPPRTPHASTPGGISAVDAATTPFDMSESLSTTFVISDSQDSLDAKARGSPPGPSLLHPQTGITVSPSMLSTGNPFRDTNRPRSSSLRNIVSSGPSAVYNVERDDRLTAAPGSLKQSDGMNHSSPIYADMILPRYLRESMNPTPNSKAFMRAEEREKAVEEYAQVPTITIIDPERAEAIPKIQSLHVRDTVLARASNYTRGLVGGSPPKPKKIAGTELQFEMVKQI